MVRCLWFADGRQEEALFHPSTLVSGLGLLDGVCEGAPVDVYAFPSVEKGEAGADDDIALKKHELFLGRIDRANNIVVLEDRMRPTSPRVSVPMTDISDS